MSSKKTRKRARERRKRRPRVATGTRRLRVATGTRKLRVATGTRKLRVATGTRRTFQINRSNILKNILISKGWKEGNKNDNIDFSYYDTYKNDKGLNAKIMVIPRRITNVIDNKNYVY